MTYIYGIGRTTAKQLCETTGVSPTAKIQDLTEEELDKLAQGQLTSEAQLEKADQVSELLSQEGSERLQDLLQRLEEGQNQVSPDEVARVMDEVARNQKDMARRLDAAGCRERS